MDEFARFGKIAALADATSTLRSKNVNICMVMQSFAQLDKNYGADDRRIIMDNYFTIQNSSRLMIKREHFEEFLNNSFSI